jgi:uncharacterized protein YbjQ (UPF0145 family)
MRAGTGGGNPAGRAARVLFSRLHQRRLEELKAFKSFTRGEISELTRLVHDTREIAIDRLKSEADQLGAEDVVGVKTYIAEIGHGLVEFMAIGTAVKKTAGVSVATSALPVQAVVPDRTPGSTETSASNWIASPRVPRPLGRAAAWPS